MNLYFPLVVALLLTGGLALGACSDDSGDSFASKCEKACEVDSASPCAGKRAECESTCTALANQASAGAGYMDGCADCIIESFSYSISTTDATQCWGILHAAPTDDTCNARCVEPDAGVAY